MIAMFRFLPLLLITTAAAQSAQPGGSPLAGLASKPGPHIDKIKAMQDNSWLELGAPAPDPKWGRARGRSWMAKMPFAPELRGAFLHGEGQHGYTKPDGHYMDDLWFYDINANRWICCYPGAPAKTLRLQLNADGFEATLDGELIPVAQQVHGYEMNTYDTDAKRMLSMPNTHSYWDRAIPQRKQWLKPPPADASPWFFEPNTGKWRRIRTGTNAPPTGNGDTLLYLPGRKQAFFMHRNQEVSFYDTTADKWRSVTPKGAKPPWGIDATSCYDPKRDRIYIGGGSYPVTPSGSNAFWIYDLKTDTWIDPKPKGSPCQGSNSYPTKNTVMVYDPANDRVLLVVHSHHDDTPERLGVYVYDPNTNAWADAPLAVPDKLGRNRQAKNGFYDPQLNVIFIHSAGDSQDDGTIWVYKPPQEGFVSLFNGRDLAGWEGDAQIWSVRDGAITGQTVKEHPLRENSYLTWKDGTIQDFELRLKYRLENGNSGIYCRAARRAADDKGPDPIIAWQADIDDKHEWTGVIMEWTRRERLANRGEKVTIDEKGKRQVTMIGDAARLAQAVKNRDWNDYTVSARGGHIVLRINGVVMSELLDSDPRRAISGLLALQVHVGPPMLVQFKDIYLKKL